MPPRTTAIGALAYYVSHADPQNYQPTNITFGIMPPPDPADGRRRLKRDERKTATSERALRALERVDRPGVGAMTKQLREFLEYLRLNRNASAHTAAAYESDITQFLGFAAQMRSMPVEALEPSHLDLGAIRAFMADLYRQGHARTSVSRKLSALRAFSRYLRREGWIENDPAALAVGPKREQKIPAHLSVDEMSRLLEMPDVSTALGRRDRAILELFYASGLRLSELVSLDLEEVNLRARMVRVMGKGAKERLVPFNTTQSNRFRTWLADRAAFVKAPEPKAQGRKAQSREPKAESPDGPAVRQLPRGTSDRPECAAARRPVCFRVQHALRDQPARVAAFVCNAPARARR